MGGSGGAFASVGGRTLWVPPNEIVRAFMWLGKTFSQEQMQRL